VVLVLAVMGKQEDPRLEAEAFCVAYGTYKDYNGTNGMRVPEKVLLLFELARM
jgi:hypothetical protein